MTAMALNPDTFSSRMLAFLRRCRLALQEKKRGSTDVINKLVSKYIFVRLRQQASSLLAPIEFGVGAPGGCELVYRGKKAAHAGAHSQDQRCYRSGTLQSCSAMSRRGDHCVRSYPLWYFIPSSLSPRRNFQMLELWRYATISKSLTHVRAKRLQLGCSEPPSYWRTPPYDKE